MAQMVASMLTPCFFVHMFDGIGPRQSRRHPQFHVLAGIEPGAAAAAEGLLADGVGRHVVELVGHVCE
jgi:hypothetical protein